MQVPLTQASQGGRELPDSECVWWAPLGEVVAEDGGVLPPEVAGPLCGGVCRPSASSSMLVMKASIQSESTSNIISSRPFTCIVACSPQPSDADTPTPTTARLHPLVQGQPRPGPLSGKQARAGGNHAQRPLLSSCNIDGNNAWP